MSRKKKGAAIAAGIALVAATVAMTAGSYAYFSADGGIPPVRASAGTLTLTIDGMNRVGRVNVANLAPGETVSHTFTVRNTGTMPGRLAVKLTSTDGSRDTLDEALVARLTSGGALLTQRAQLRQLTDQPGAGTDSGVLRAGESRTIRLDLRFGERSGNRFQGATTSFSVSATLDQIVNQ